MDAKSALYPQRMDRFRERIDSIMFVDPGLCGTGIALWRGFDTKPRSPSKPDQTEVIKAKKVAWQSTVSDIMQIFRGYLIAAKPHALVIEFPEVWAESSTSMAAATKGDLSKLLYLIGGMGEACRRLLLYEPILVAPREWKGQLPKEVVLRRIREKLGIAPRDHEGDAIGMGLAAQGHL